MPTPNVATTVKIGHESEYQRQYIRIAIAASARVNEKEYDVLDLSSGGFSIKSSEDVFPASVLNLELHFRFENFSFHQAARARLVYHRNGRAGFVFNDMSARQVSLLNYIIKSYISGLIISEGDILNVATRNDFAKIREGNRSNDNEHKNWFARIVPFAVVLAVGLAGLLFLFGNIYESTLVIKSSMSVVDGNTYTVRAEANGAYYSLLAKDARQVTKDQSLGVIRDSSVVSSSTGALPQAGITLKSPCDCIVVRQFFHEGEFHVLGDPLVELVPTDSKPWVIANLAPNQASRLKLQDTAYVQLVGDNKFFEGNVTEFLTPSLDKDFVQVKIKMQAPLPLGAIGHPAYAEFTVY